MRILLCKRQLMGPITGADETIVTYASQLQSAGQQPTVLLRAGLHPWSCSAALLVHNPSQYCARITAP